MMNSIDTVIFDVGWVLVQLDFQYLLECLNQDGHCYTVTEILAAIDLEAHERGEINGEQLIDNLHGMAPGIDRQRMKHAWLEMFLPVESMWRLARSLSSCYRVHLLSNVGELHWLHLNNRFDLRALAHDALPSFTAGVMKPHEDIYRQAEQRFKLRPEATVFIDDLEPNVRAARTRGWHAIQHQTPEQTMQELRELGVECG